MTTGRFWATILATLLVTLVFLARPCNEAHPHDPADLVLANVGVDERLNAAVPTDLTFLDQNGRRARLAEYLTGTPVILTLNYYACPTLCPLVFRNLVDTMHQVKGLSFGTDYRVVTVSIDPQETAARAQEKAATTYGMLGHVAAPERNWPFLRGNQKEIAELSRSVGVRYARLESGEYAHPSVVIVLTPAGRVSRYLYGMALRPQDFKIALLEAAGGKIGKAQILNQALLYCFHYDPVGKKYVLLANRVMFAAMTAIFLLLSTLLIALWLRERKSPHN